MPFKPRPAVIRHFLAAGLGLAIILYLIPFFLTAKPAPGQPPGLAWAPGYWEASPLLGIVRIVPLARASLVNPAAQAAPDGSHAHPREKTDMPKTSGQDGDALRARFQGLAD